MEKAIKNKQQKKYFSILGRTYWRIFAYFIIYSIIGFFIETIFGLAKYGYLESRQSFLYGPFCGIYGIGAIVMVLSLQYFKKDHITLFIGGCIVGSVVEYVISLIGDLIFHAKWWDYSEMPLNINGRICLLYAFFWGFLGLFLMISINPRIDKLINYIKEKVSTHILQIFVAICTIFLLIDCIATGIALFCFTVRTIKEKEIDVNNQAYISSVYEKIYSNETNVNIINKFFNNEKMLMTFPRLTIEKSNGEIVMVKDYYPNIKTYYYKLNLKEKSESK